MSLHAVYHWVLSETAKDRGQEHSFGLREGECVDRGDYQDLCFPEEGLCQLKDFANSGTS